MVFSISIPVIGQERDEFGLDSVPSYEEIQTKLDQISAGRDFTESVVEVGEFSKAELQSIADQLKASSWTRDDVEFAAVMFLPGYLPEDDRILQPTLDELILSEPGMARFDSMLVDGTAFSILPRLADPQAFAMLGPRVPKVMPPPWTRELIYRRIGREFTKTTKILGRVVEKRFTPRAVKKALETGGPKAAEAAAKAWLEKASRLLNRLPKWWPSKFTLIDDLGALYRHPKPPINKVITTVKLKRSGGLRWGPRGPYRP
jgi:hypothetical protein